MVTVSEDDLRELVAAVRERTFSYEAGRERFRERLAGFVASRLLDRDSLAGQDEAMSAVRKTKEYQRLATRAWPRETPEGLVEKLFKNRARLTRVAGDLLSGEELDLLLKSSAAVKRKDMTPTDVALLDEAHWLIDPGFRRFGHVVVDEAQNLTPMELRMTVRRARGQSLTILGDLSQRTADAGVSSWEAVLREAGVERHDVSELRVSYRVPNEFLVLAGTLLPEGAPAPRGRARGAVPAARRASTTTSAAAVARVARRFSEEVGSVGVVLPAVHFEAVRAALGEAVDATREPLSAGINLLDLHVTKGLEFDAIVVVEPAAILAERPDGGPGGLYTALTRATRALAIVHAEPLPQELLDAECCGQKLTATYRRIEDMDFKLELIAVPVSDVDRAKAFYVEKAGFNADHDHTVNENLRFVQLTPPGSGCSIAIGKGLLDSEPGSIKGLQLVVTDIEAARAELVGRGMDVSEIDRQAWGAFVYFQDPDGNAWAVQDISGGTAG